MKRKEAQPSGSNNEDAKKTSGEKQPSWQTFDPEAALAQRRAAAAEKRQRAAELEAQKNEQANADIEQYRKITEQIHGKQAEISEQSGLDLESIRSKSELHERLSTIEAKHSPRLTAALDELAAGETILHARKFHAQLKSKVQEWERNQAEMTEEIGEEAYRELMQDAQAKIEEGQADLEQRQQEYDAIDRKVMELAAPIRRELSHLETAQPTSAEEYRALLEQLGAEIRSHDELLGPLKPMLKELEVLEGELAELLERPAVIEHRETEQFAEQLREMKDRFSLDLIINTESAYGRDVAFELGKLEGKKVAEAHKQLDKELKRHLAEAAFDSFTAHFFAKFDATTPAQQQELLRHIQDGLRYGLINYARNYQGASNYEGELRGVSRGVSGSEEIEQAKAELAGDVLTLKAILALEPGTNVEDIYIKEALVLYPEKYNEGSQVVRKRAKHVYKRLATHRETLQRILAIAQIQQQLQEQVNAKHTWQDTAERASHELLPPWVRKAAGWIRGKHGYTKDQRVPRPVNSSGYGIHPWMPYSMKNRTDFRLGSGETAKAEEAALKLIGIESTNVLTPKINELAKLRASEAKEKLATAEQATSESEAALKQHDEKHSGLIKQHELFQKYRERTVVHEQGRRTSELKQLLANRQEAKKALEGGGFAALFNRRARQEAFDIADNEYREKYQKAAKWFQDQVEDSFPSSMLGDPSQLEQMLNEAYVRVRQEWGRIREEFVNYSVDRSRLDRTAKQANYERAKRSSNPWVEYSSENHAV